MDCRTNVRIGKLVRKHPVSGVRKKITFLEEENSEGHWTINLYRFTHLLLFGGKKKKPTLPEEPVQDERSRESFREETHVPRCVDQILSHFITCILLISDEGNESILYTDLCTGKTLVMDKCLFFVDKNFHSEKDLLLGFCWLDYNKIAKGIALKYSNLWASLVAQLVKNPYGMPGNLGSISRLGRSLREGKGHPLQYSGLENSMDCIVHGGHKRSETTEQL